MAVSVRGEALFSYPPPSRENGIPLVRAVRTRVMAVSQRQLHCRMRCLAPETGWGAAKGLEQRHYPWGLAEGLHQGFWALRVCPKGLHCSVLKLLAFLFPEDPEIQDSHVSL